MAQNFPGPLEIEFAYTVAGVKHKMRQSFSVAPPATVTPGQNPNTIFPLLRDTGASPVSIVQHTQDLVDKIQPIFNDTDASGGVVDVYEYTPGTYDRTWITSFTSGFVPSSAIPTGLASQTTLTFRSTKGGIGRLVLLETVGSTNDQIEPGDFDLTIQELVTEFVSNGSPWRTRDDGFFLTPIRLSPGQNETIWRKRYR